MKETWEIITAQAQSHDAVLIAVSKTKPVHEIQRMYDLGQRKFGENRVQELLDKVHVLPDDIEWHMIGHLQRNKVKDVVPLVQTIHAVDSLRLLREIEKQASKVERRVSVLLQFKIAEEESKYGFDSDSLQEAANFAIQHCKFTKVIGLMGMATFTEDLVQVRQEFSRLHDQFKVLQLGLFANDTDFKELSMGMSGDYEIALEEGSTMIRVGSLLFGARH